MSFTSAVHVLLQERQLDLFDVVFLQSTNKDLQLLCGAHYVHPTDLAYNLYVILYKALLQNITFHILYAPIYTCVLIDGRITITEHLPLNNQCEMHTRYRKHITGSKTSNKDNLRAAIEGIESFDDIIITLFHHSRNVCEAVHDIHALMKKHDKNIKISIILK